MSTRTRIIAASLAVVAGGIAYFALRAPSTPADAPARNAPVTRVTPDDPIVAPAAPLSAAQPERSEEEERAAFVRNLQDLGFMRSGPNVSSAPSNHRLWGGADDLCAAFVVHAHQTGQAPNTLIDGAGDLCAPSRNFEQRSEAGEALPYATLNRMAEWLKLQR